MKRLFLLAALSFPAVLMFSACGDSTGAATSTGDDPALASCTSAPLCETIGFPSACTFGAAGITCSAADAGVDAGDSDAGPTSPGGPDLTARLQCALEALRDRKTGGLALLVPENGSKSCGVRVEIVSFGDGTASVLDVGYCDLDVVRGTAVRSTLKPASFFDDCLASPDETTRLQCLAGAFKKATAAGGTCSCRGISGDEIRGTCATN
jgi:hypothetical protein